MTRAMANSPALLDGYLALNVLTNLFNSLVQVDNDRPVIAPRNAAA